MASDNHASYAKIGLTVALGVIAVVATLIYLGGLRGRRNVVLIETYYDKPVTGLSVGSAVNFRGVKIGEVRDISFIGSRYDGVEGEDNSRIYILMSVNAETLDFNATPADIERQIQFLVRERGMRATVSINGITGLARIEMNLNKGDEYKTVPSVSWAPRHVCVPPKDSLIDSFSVAATKVMNQINKMDLNTFWSNLNVSVEKVSYCVETANTVLETRQADTERILENLTATSESLRQLSAELRQNPSALVRGVDRPPLAETAR